MSDTRTDPLRIGLITPAWPGRNTANGIATAVAHLAAGLERCDHEVTIIPFEIDAPHDRTRIVPLPDHRWSLADRVRLKLGRDVENVVHNRFGHRIAAAVQEAVARHGIEIAVIEETQGWAEPLCRLVPIPVVITLHGPWCLHKNIQGHGDAGADNRREARELRALRRARGIISPARDTLVRTEALWDLPDIPRRVIHNPMPVPPASSSGDPERLLFVGRFDFHKGGDIVIDAFARIATRHPSCRLTFVGPDPGVERTGQPTLTLPEALARLPDEIRTRIDVLGQCDREQVAALRQSHGLTIVASRYENFGGTILEAMAAGSALVCTDVGGGPEVISHGETALLVPPENAQALADACLSLLDDPGRAQDMGKAARKYVENHLSPEVIGQKVADFLGLICRR